MESPRAPARTWRRSWRTSRVTGARVRRRRRQRHSSWGSPRRTCTASWWRPRRGQRRTCGSDAARSVYTGSARVAAGVSHRGGVTAGPHDDPGVVAVAVRCRGPGRTADRQRSDVVGGDRLCRRVDPREQRPHPPVGAGAATAQTVQIGGPGTALPESFASPSRRSCRSGRSGRSPSPLSSIYLGWVECRSPPCCVWTGRVGSTLSSETPACGSVRSRASCAS